VELFREYVRLLIEAEMFEEWLSPDVVNLLVEAYARPPSPSLSALKWTYSDCLGGNTWGAYSGDLQLLYVNSGKTKGLFKQQVQTLLHEIQHWNRHTKIAQEYPANPIEAFGATAMLQKRRFGYWQSPVEVDARAFAARHLDEALGKINDLFRKKSGKVEGMSIEDAVEELMNAFLDSGEKPLTRLQIGEVLRDFDLNNGANMADAIKRLTMLGVKVK
jgi:hypothetical protein